MKQKSKPQNKQLNQFKKQCKLILSSLSARGCKYLYLHPSDRRFVVTNIDSELASTLSSKSLISVHLVKVSEEFRDQFLELFVGDIPGDTIYVFKAALLMRAISKYDLDDVSPYVDPFTHEVFLTHKGDTIAEKLAMQTNEDEEDTSEDEGALTLSETEKILAALSVEDHVDRTMYHSDVSVGAPLVDPYTITILEETCAYADEGYSMCSSDEVPNTKISADEMLDSSRSTHSNWYVIESDKSDIVRQRFLVVDGLDNPSMREFISKIGKKTISTFYMYRYLTCNNTLIKNLSYYCDEHVSIISTRPFNSILFLENTEDKGRYTNKLNY